VNTIKNNFISNCHAGGGTRWSSIFPELEKKGNYIRVFIMSDEQNSDSVEASYKDYCNKFGTPHVYVINLCGYGPTAIKQSTRVHKIYGYHAGIFETAKQVEIDPEAIIKEINEIVI
jgi:hypothetical protein